MRFQMASLDGRLVYVSKQPHTGHGVCVPIEAENVEELIQKFNSLGIVVFDLDSGMKDDTIPVALGRAVFQNTLITVVPMPVEEKAFHRIGIAVGYSNQPLVYVSVKETEDSYVFVLRDNGDQRQAMLVMKEN